MPKLSVLHLSDIHIGNNIYETAENIAIPVIEALENHDKEINCVVITGDIFDGKSENPDKGKRIALGLLNYLKNELCLKVSDFVIIPGNHDLIREDTKANFENYIDLLKSFYGNDHYDELINSEFLFTTRVYKDKKVAIVGLNSCMIEPSKLEKKDIKWMNKLPNLDNSMQNKILEALEDEKRNEWDDYGCIEKKQLRASFKSLESQIDDLFDYTIVACFHHHFYPFPEIYNKYGDSSIIRNFTDVIEKFQQKNVKIVLHGHKHIPIIRPVTNYRYLSDPESIFYVFSAGSLGKKGIVNRSFQQIDVHSPDQNRKADVCRFNYKLEQLQSPEEFRIPPQKQYEQNAYVELLNILKEEYFDEYKKYNTEVYESDNISHQFNIDDIIKNISITITQFDTIKKDLESSVEKIKILLFSIHYRINYLSYKVNKNNSRGKILATLKEKYSLLFKDKLYENLVIKLLESDRNKHFEKVYDDLMTKHHKFRNYTAYITLAIFFTDLYLTFSRYGELYYTNERIKHNVNIKLEDDTFHENIPVSTIKITSDVDRRLATIHFKCKNPTVHKIAVLIVKDFEKRINKIEESFKQLGLKIYYLIPKIIKDNYDLDNFNFKAYIPTLLPLLTGDNLYKEKEVFIRELIQNSLDAILLREDILRKKGLALSESQKEIRIIIGKSKNPQTGKERKYLKIVDNGIGMDAFRIERYFTSIGRSFYVSDEFDELQKNEEIDYKPISNFGIGFLSAFMICKEIEVITKSYEEGVPGLVIHIPNYDGCFFIKKDENSKLEPGTTITLYEDERKFLKPDKIIDYIKNTFIDFQLTIKIENKIDNTEETIEAFSIRRNKFPILFCPIENHKIKEISWSEEIKDYSFKDKYNYGIMLEFDKDVIMLQLSRGRTIRNSYLNSGILLSDSYIKQLNFSETEYSRLYYNFPSSYLNLDVAREKILSVNSNAISKKKIFKALAKQSIELLVDINTSCKTYPIALLNNIARFFIRNRVKSQQIESLKENLYYLKFHNNSEDYTISLEKGVKNSFIELDFSAMVNIYLSISQKIIALHPKQSETKKIQLEKSFSKLKDEVKSNFNNSSKNMLGKDFSDIFEDEVKSKFNNSFKNMLGKDFDDIVEDVRHIFDREIIHNSSNKVFDKFGQTYKNKLENLSHILNSEIRHVFDKQFSHTFDGEFMEMLHIDYIHMLKNLYQRSDHFLFRVSDDNYNMLVYLILSSLINSSKHGVGRHYVIEQIFGLFLVWYELLIRKLTVEEAMDFKVVLKHLE